MFLDHVSLTLTHQYLDQFDRTPQAAGLGTARTLVTFQTMLRASRLLEHHFDDLPIKSLHQMSSRWACVFSHNAFYVRLAPVPKQRASDTHAIIDRCRDHYARHQATLETDTHGFLSKLH